MAIEIECECCKSTIRVRDELAGRTGSCRHCGSSITIPRPEDALANRQLAEATPEEMIQELRRRRHRPLLLLLDGDKAHPLGGSAQVATDDRQHAALKVFGGEAFNQLQLADIYQHLANAAEQRQETFEAIEKQTEKDVFELKGDELGMSLADFKQKHARLVESSGKMVPWCSDELPGQRIADLLAEPWHTAAGIVHARIDLPEENSSPTIAGVPSQMVLYQFLDGKLFQISAFFAPEGFHALCSALGEKFGEPVSEQQIPRRLRWWTMASSIDLTQGSLRPPEPTVLAYYHDELIQQASKRKQNRTSDL